MWNVYMYLLAVPERLSQFEGGRLHILPWHPLEKPVCELEVVSVLRVHIGSLDLFSEDDLLWQLLLHLGDHERLHVRLGVALNVRIDRRLRARHVLELELGDHEGVEKLERRLRQAWSSNREEEKSCWEHAVTWGGDVTRGHVTRGDGESG